MESKSGACPLKGQQTGTILRELGYSEGEMGKLKQRGVIDWEDP